MRVLVTGSRDLTNWKAVYDELSRFAPARKLTVVVGDCPTGADKYARDWVRARGYPRNIDVGLEEHFANWERKCDEKCYHPPKFKPVTSDEITVLVPYCPVAGHIRNQEMVDSGADICLAFYKIGAKNRGTRDCAARAKKAGIKVVKFREVGPR